MIVSLSIGGLLRTDSHWLLQQALIIVGRMTNGIFIRQFYGDDQ